METLKKNFRESVFVLAAIAWLGLMLVSLTTPADAAELEDYRNTWEYSA